MALNAVPKYHLIVGAVEVRKGKSPGHVSVARHGIHGEFLRHPGAIGDMPQGRPWSKS